MEKFKPKILYGEDEKVYHSVPAVSKHYMDQFLKAPAAFKYAIEHGMKQESSDTFLLGSLFHCMVLEPAKLEARYRRKEFLGTTKDGKKEIEKAKMEGVTLVRKDIWDTATGMASTLCSTNLWQTMKQEELYTEVSIYWEYDDILPCKARVDGFYKIDGRYYAFDLKSCTDASSEAISKSIALFGYHRQSVWYKSALAQVDIPVDAFVFIFVEKTPPYLYNVCTISENAECKANDEIREALQGLKECTLNDKWPGLFEDVLCIDMPLWAYKDKKESEVAS